MNVLFISLAGIRSVEEKGIYTDLLREIIKNDNDVYIISPAERRTGLPTEIIKTENNKRAHILSVRTGNIQKASYIEKGISQIFLEGQLTQAIKKYFSNVKFDLVLYATPPVTLIKPIKYIKKRDKATTYLMLKDIFPQNAVDIGIMNTGGLKGILYKHFRKKEKKLYKISDRIGCMSQANVNYIIERNPEVNPEVVEICPNSIEVIDKCVDKGTRVFIRNKYEIPLDKKVLVYGGNLGKPQGIPFLIECLKQCADVEEVFFLIVGDGTEYRLLSDYVESGKPKNVRVMKRLPKEDYDTMVGACDVGLIFLDHRFTIPNFPSRLLSYMQAKIPVVAVTDPNTDIGKVITEGGFGWWCESDDTKAFVELVKKICDEDWTAMKATEYEYLQKHYSSKGSYDIIMRHLNN